MHREACRVLITDESGTRLLLAKRATHDYGGGLWGALGGKLDEGELPETAVVRETFEESGLVLSGVKFFAEHINDTWRTYFFEATTTGELFLDVSEHTEAGYFDIDQLDTLEMAFDHLDIFKDYLSRNQPTG